MGTDQILFRKKNEKIVATEAGRGKTDVKVVSPKPQEEAEMETKKPAQVVVQSPVYVNLDSQNLTKRSMMVKNHFAAAA